MRKAAVVLAIVFGISGCVSSPTASPTSSPQKASAAPSSSPVPVAANSNPSKLGPNDCTAPPPSQGTQVHSSVLGLTVTLPAPWAESPENEGKQGLEAAFDIRTGPGPAGADLSMDPWPATTMTAHQVAIWASTQPGAGNVVATGDCIIAGGDAGFFEATIDLSTFPGVTLSSDGYAVWVAHGSQLVYLLIDLPSDTTVNGTPVSSPIPGPPLMAQVKGILGSWTWDQP